MAINCWLYCLLCL